MLALCRIPTVASFLGLQHTGRSGSQLRVLSRDFAASSTGSSQQSSDDNTNDAIIEPLVVCGPSGVGKGTIINKYMEELGGSDLFGFSVSHTTRDPRPGEENGVHYHFTSLEAMKRDIDEGLFLEHAEVHGNYYGTSWQTLRDSQLQGKRCLLDIDVQGVKHLKSYCHGVPTFQPKYVFVAPPSLESLLQRLEGRGTETAESLARRTANAKAEVEYGMTKGNFDCIVVNDDLDQACQDFQQAVDSMYKTRN